MTMPNFLVIGVAKAGTTSLHAYLAQHPQIFMSAIKEPHFFAYEGGMPEFRGPGDPRPSARFTTRLEDYQALFEAVTTEQAIGESSVGYLFCEQAAARIRRRISDVRLIAILRDPAERAFSHYMMKRCEGCEPLADFRQALQAEEERRRNRWHWSWFYRQRGLYAEQLARYFALFERSQMRIYLYEEWDRDNLAVLRDIFGFLQVDDTFQPDIQQRHRLGGIPQNRRLHHFINRPHWLKTLLRPLTPRRWRQWLYGRLMKANRVQLKLDPTIRAELIESYRPDVLKLQDMLERDLSAWLKV